MHVSALFRHLQPFAGPTRRYNVGQLSLACHINTACLSEEHDSELVDGSLCALGSENLLQDSRLCMQAAQQATAPLTT
jgi:hypothetical protein